MALLIALLLAATDSERRVRGCGVGGTGNPNTLV